MQLANLDVLRQQMVDRKSLEIENRAKGLIL